MEPWIWLVAYLLGFALLQLLLYRYFREETAGIDGANWNETEPTRPRADGGARQSTDDTIYCQHCGAGNERDQAYTFCRQCAEPLQ